MKYQYTSTMMSKIGKTEITKFSENVEQKELFIHCYWEVNWFTHFGRESGTFPYNLSLALLGIHPQYENIFPQKDSYRMFIAVYY